MRTMITGLLAVILSTSAALAETLTAYDSKFSSKETADRLVAELDKSGIKLAARIDHAAAAKAAGMDMPPAEVVMFGNPKLGTPLMLAQPTVAIDLPMKVLIWQDPAGKVKIGYVAPAIMKQRHQLSGHDEIVKTMTGALDALTKAASGH